MRSHQKFWNPREVLIKRFFCPAPGLEECGRGPCTQAHRVTEAARGFSGSQSAGGCRSLSAHHVAWNCWALAWQSCGSQSCNSPGGAGLGRDEPRKMWVSGSCRGGSLICLGPGVVLLPGSCRPPVLLSSFGWKLVVLRLSCSQLHPYWPNPEQVLRKCLMNL